MKIAFVGKGGSGKTTLSALFARSCAELDFPVLAIDADINQHMASALGMAAVHSQQIPPMGLQINQIKNYCRGTNPRISDIDAMIKTTPPGHGSRLIKVTEDNPIYRHFLQRVGRRLGLMAVGPFDESDLGIRCYHSKTGAVELFLNHLIDAEKEYVIVDMTAGADSFASGLFTRFDMTFLVVEPTMKSLSVYEQYKKYAREHDVLIRVIGNKIESSADIDFIKKSVGDDLVACFSLSAFVKKTDKGNHQPISALEPENAAALEKMLAVVDSCKKDWKKYYRQAVEFHLKNAESWASEAVGKDLTTQIDPDFSYPPVISSA